MFQALEITPPATDNLPLVQVRGGISPQEVSPEEAAGDEQVFQTSLQVGTVGDQESFTAFMEQQGVTYKEMDLELDENNFNVTLNFTSLLRVVRSSGENRYFRIVTMLLWLLFCGC